MAIFNAGGGGTALQYVLKVSKERPIPSKTKKTIWIKDSLEFLNPYENENNEQLVTTKITANVLDKAEIDKNKKPTNECNAMFVHVKDELQLKYLHLDRTSYKVNSITSISPGLDTSYPYLQLTIPKKSGDPAKTDATNKLTIGFSSDPLGEGISIAQIIEVFFPYSATVNQTLNLPINCQVNKKDGSYYQHMYILQNDDTYANASSHAKITIKGYQNENFSGGSTKNYKVVYNYGSFVNKCIIADTSNTYTTHFLNTDLNKSYRIFVNNNLNYLFTVPNPVNGIEPDEGDFGEIITENSDGVFYNKDENYYLISGEKYSNICLTYNDTIDNKPYILDGSYTMDFQNIAKNSISLTEKYPINKGYIIDSFMPTELNNIQNNERLFWIVSGNNQNINFEIIKSNKKRNFVSFEAVIAKLPYEDQGKKHDLLYFLHAECCLDGENWIPLKSNSNQFFNLESLLEGNLSELYYDENESLRDYAFYKYKNLESINFPNCSTIGASAFAECNNLENIDLPMWNYYTDLSLSNVCLYSKGVNNSPFISCSNIKKANIGFTRFADGSLSKTTLLSTASPFFNASATIENLTLNSCSYIGSYTFYNCTSLNTITLGEENPVSIGTSAFTNNNNLTNIINNSMINNIAPYAFTSCTNLKNLNLIDISFIGNGAFQNCINLSTILDFTENENQNQLETIGQSAFFNTAIQKINAPNCKRFGTDSSAYFKGYNINSSPIAKCSSLQELTLGWENKDSRYGLPAIFAKTNLPSLTSISFSNITLLSNSVFKQADSLKNVTLSDTLSIFPQEAFALCGKIVNTILPLTEFGFSTYEFQYESLLDSDGNEIYEQEKNSQNYPCKLKYIKNPNNESEFIPLLDENENPIYVITDDKRDLYLWEKVNGNEYILYNNDTDADQTDDYYLPNYDYNKPIYSNIVKKDYSKIKYEIYDVEDENSNATIITENNTTIVTKKNERIYIPEIFNYTSEYDDEIYRYDVDEDGKVSNLIINPFCYYKQKVSEDGITPLFKQAKDENGNELFEQMLDENGKPMYEQMVDGNGNPVYNKKMEPVYDENGQPVRDENGNQIFKQVDDLDSPVYDTDKPRYDTSKPLPDYSKPIILKALYDTNLYALDREMNDDRSPKLNAAKEIVYISTSTTEGIEYLNKYYKDKNNLLLFLSGIQALGVKSIGNSCFQSCINLKEIYLQDFVNEVPSVNGAINNLAFYNCSSLEIVDAPYTKTISYSKTNWPFVNCSMLRSINLDNLTINASAKNNAFPIQIEHTYNKKQLYPSLEDIKLNKINILRSNTFSDCASLKTGIFNTCTSVYSGAFYNTGFGYITTNLIYTSNRVSATTDTGDTILYEDQWKISDNDYLNFMKNNPSLNSYFNNVLQLPNLIFNSYSISNATTLSAFQNIFAKCSQLKGAYLGSNITALPKFAFAHCSNIENITQKWDNAIGYNCIYIPEVSIIGPGAFYYCGEKNNDNEDTIYSGLSYISFTSTITKIDTQAFEGCQNLQTVYFDTGANAQYTTLVINASAFKDCPNLKEVKNIPPKLTAIGSDAFNFQNSEKINELNLDFTLFTVNDSIPTVTSNAFPVSDLITLNFANKEVKDKFASAPNWSTYSNRMAYPLN